MANPMRAFSLGWELCEWCSGGVAKFWAPFTTISASPPTPQDAAFDVYAHRLPSTPATIRSIDRPFWAESGSLWAVRCLLSVTRGCIMD